MEFVRYEYDNKKTTTAELNGHQETIEEYAAKGCRYVGFIPVKFGPSGKTLAIDLIFENK